MLPAGLIAQSKPVAPSLAKASPANETQNILTEAVGLFGGLQLYNTYLNIGLLADAMANDIYEVGDVSQLLGSVILPLERVDMQLEKLKKVPLSTDDRQALAQMSKIVSLLRTQGKELQVYWENGDDESAAKFETARLAAYKELNNLLELEPKEEKLPTPRVLPSAR
jgi:hypothetical protein